jgi:rubrerythrin
MVTMGRLIDADAFDKRIRLAVGSCEEELTEDFKDGISTILEMMKTAPTVDAVPVVHGGWKEDPSGYGFWICSACGFVSEASAADMLYKFCPVCGAKMDGKDGESE